MASLRSLAGLKAALAQQAPSAGGAQGSQPARTQSARPAKSKRDLMLEVLNMEAKPGYVPAGFFMHFGLRGDAAVKAHLDYFRGTGMDFVKIQFDEVGEGVGRLTVFCYFLDRRLGDTIRAHRTFTPALSNAPAAPSCALRSSWPEPLPSLRVARRTEGVQSVPEQVGHKTPAAKNEGLRHSQKRYCAMLIAARTNPGKQNASRPIPPLTI